MRGYTCNDLFLQDVLLENAINGLQKIKEETKELDIISIIGCPIRHDNQLFNTAVVVQKGKILGIVPKTYIPNYNEFYEKRWFASSNNVKIKKIVLLGEEVPFHVNLLFQDMEDPMICFAVEICEDLWSPIPPSVNHTLNGATMIFNLSGSNEIIAKYEYRKDLVKMQSSKTISAYIYASSSALESTTDVVFSGHSLIYENGTLLEEGERFSFDSKSIITDIDVKKIMHERRRNISYMGKTENNEYEIVYVNVKDRNKELLRIYDAYPFVPKNERVRESRCEEILAIQSTALAKRLEFTGIKKTVIGISGGLDSTLAFLVILEAYKKLNLDFKNIIAITMPGFGTTNRTYQNAIRFVESYGATLKEINIKEACLLHFKDIDHNPEVHDVTYENVQARERTQILMDIANKEGALVIGTGDLSELALGWCTYNGDHMSMYAVNTSIPKTLVRYLVNYVASKTKDECKRKVLEDIVNTPVSPELLPPDKNGKILQKTENSIGPYVLHDFYLYHFLRDGMNPKKIYFLACKTFQDCYDKEEIKHWLSLFLKRFFSQQFKRSCIPDGVKVGSVSLSPRGDFRMPSDADVTIWLQDLESV